MTQDTFLLCLRPDGIVFVASTIWKRRKVNYLKLTSANIFSWKSGPWNTIHVRIFYLFFAESPSNFYFYEILDDIQLTLKQAFKTKSSIPRQNEFVADELVAVSITAAAGDKSWYRAKVLNDAIVYPEDGEDLLAPVEVELELIDYGIRTVKSSADIAILPSKLCQFAPLVRE